MNISLLVAAIAVLFIVIAVSEPLAARLRLPYSVVLAVVGAVLGGLALSMDASEISTRFAPSVQAILSLPIKSQFFLYVFLPTLLFQVALGLNLRRLMDDWVPILVLAVAAVLVATFFVGGALTLVSGMSFLACLLLGSIVSTTDPSAVVTIFRSTAAPQRLARIVEGESLLNDAAAVALFGFFLAFVMAGIPNPTLKDALIGFPTIIFGGILAGWVFGRVFLKAMTLVPAFPMAQITLSVALPYLTYVITDKVFEASGVIAVVTAGMTLNWVGQGRLAPTAWTNLREVWDLLAHWAGALIFVLAALLIPRMLGDATLRDFGLVMVVVGAAALARVVMLWGVLPLLSHWGMSPVVERPYRIAILWGGLRGAVTLALALAVTENILVPAEVRREVGIIATGFTLFTLFVQGTTLRGVIRRLGLARLTPIDLALSQQVIAVALQNVREEVAETTKRHELNRDIVRSEAKRFAARLGKSVALAEQAEEIQDRDRITLGLLALAGRERDLIIEGVRDREIPDRLAERMLSNADLLIERTRLAGRPGYLSAGRRAIGFGRSYRLAVAAHNRLGLPGPLSEMTASRFEILLSKRLILSNLHSYIDGKIRRIHGRRVAELLHDVLRRREEELQTALDGLRLQYPGYAEEMERGFIRRMALRLEEAEYDTLQKDGLIGQELHLTLRQSLDDTRRRLSVRPKLDLAVQTSELVGLFPLFAEMEPDQRTKLTQGLSTIYAQPGDVLIRKGDPARYVYFIASGAVNVETAGQNLRLGRGEMFGQLAMLTRKPRRAQITAITYCRLLRLDEDRFKQVLSRNPALRETILENARLRGVLIDLETPPAP